MAESSQYKMEARSLGPGNLQASPGDHTHDGITSKELNIWTAWTPSWTAVTTQPVLNNGTLVGNYSVVGNLVFFNIVLTVGSTTTFGSGEYRLSLPFTPDASLPAYFPVGVATLQDTSSGVRNIFFPDLVTVSTATVRLQATTTASIWSPTAPFTLASTDIVMVNGYYRKA